MKRLECLQLLYSAKGDGVTVATMRAIQDWYDVGGGPELHIDNRGCMGAAAALGLGLALAMPRRRVIVIDGDGSLCMQLGGLVSIAGEAPKNFYHVVLVNRIYETSGAQPIPAANKVDFALLAQGAGYVHAAHISDIAALEANLGSIMSLDGPVLIALEVDEEPTGRPLPANRPQDPAGYLRQALVG